MKRSHTPDLKGQVFEFYTVIERDENVIGSNGKSIKSRWKCKCICGNERVVRGDHLRAKLANSCGCRKTLKHRRPRTFDKAYTVKYNGCWEWNGYTDKDGYPRIGDESMPAHRYSYERFKGPIPEGMLVCHSCDNPKCVNPEHLWVGTQKQNIQDMIIKQRHPYIGKIKKDDKQNRLRRIKSEQNI